LSAIERLKHRERGIKRHPGWDFELLVRSLDETLAQGLNLFHRHGTCTAISSHDLIHLYALDVFASFSSLPRLVQVGLKLLVVHLLLVF